MRLNVRHISTASISRARQLRNSGLSIYGCHPAAYRLHPCSVIGAACVSYIYKGTCGQPGHSFTVEIGCFDLTKARRGLPEYEHDLRHALVGGQTATEDAASV